MNLFYRLFVAFIFFFLSVQAFAFNMSEDRRLFEQDLRRNSLPANRVNLAIFFQTENREELKTRADLIELKREIASEFLKGVRVADPTIVNEIVRQKNVDVENLENRKDTLSELSLILTNNLFMVSKVSPTGTSEILVDYKTYNNRGKVISHFQQIHRSGEDSGKQTSGGSLAYFSTKEHPREEKVAQSDDYFNPGQYGLISQELKDSTYGHFTPTAFLTPEEFYLETSVWFSNLSKVNAAIKFFRFSYRYEIVQLELESRGSDDGVHHSSFLQSRVQIFNQDNFPIPLNLVLGLRGRIYRNDQNIDYVKFSDKARKVVDEDQTDENRDLDRLSLFLATSYSIKQINSVVNFYLDNLKHSVRFRANFPYRFSAAAELVMFRYDGNAKDEDQSQEYSDPDFAVSGGYDINDRHGVFVTYQNRTQQFIMGYKGNF